MSDYNVVDQMLGLIVQTSKRIHSLVRKVRSPNLARDAKRVQYLLDQSLSEVQDLVGRTEEESPRRSVSLRRPRRSGRAVELKTPRALLDITTFLRGFKQMILRTKGLVRELEGEGRGPAAEALSEGLVHLNQTAKSFRRAEKLFDRDSR